MRILTKACVEEGAMYLSKKRAPRLASLVDFIERELGDVYNVRVRKSTYVPTGATLSSGVRINDYKERDSTVIEVYRKGNPCPIWRYESGSAYASNRVVCNWILDKMRDLGRR